MVATGHKIHGVENSSNPEVQTKKQVYSENKKFGRLQFV
jgi:hypothetical protein